MNEIEHCPYCRRRLEEDAGVAGCHCGRLRPHSAIEPGDGETLLAVVRKYGILLPHGRAKDWRAATGTGEVPAFGFRVTLLATDGTVAWFVRYDGSLWHGQLAAFRRDRAVRDASTGVPRKSKAKAKQDLLDLI